MSPRASESSRESGSLRAFASSLMFSCNVIWNHCIIVSENTRREGMLHMNNGYLLRELEKAWTCLRN